MSGGDRSQIRRVTDFWFGAVDDPERNRMRKVWFAKDSGFDAAVRDEFGATIEAGLGGKLEHWTAAAEGALAFILVLDQFTRNAFRGTARAFAGDARALKAARIVVERGWDRALPGVQRQFLYLPFEHAEDLAAQEQSLALFRQLAADEPALADGVMWAERHHAIVARFGRFPHRNLALGRASTDEEAAFLKTEGSSF